MLLRRNWGFAINEFITAHRCNRSTEKGVDEAVFPGWDLAIAEEFTKRVQLFGVQRGKPFSIPRRSIPVTYGMRLAFSNLDNSFMNSRVKLSGMSVIQPTSWNRSTISLNKKDAERGVRRGASGWRRRAPGCENLFTPSGR